VATAEAPARARSPSLRGALQRAGRLLARRPHSAAELRERLGAAGFERAAVEGALVRLTELGLVDDRAFAEAWIEHRAGRGLAGSAILAELDARGVEPAVAEEALERAGLDDGARARELAAAWVAKVASLPLERQAARVQGMLLRRGFTPEVAAAASRAVLPPEGWD
jgi:regulatory protein